jgi:hypothetical protein
MSGTTWKITITDAAQARVLFVGTTRDRVELQAVCVEARRLRPTAPIILTPPLGGEPYEWPGPPGVGVI